MCVHNLVLIKKIDKFSDCWSNLVRMKKNSSLSVEELISKYNGFEGDLVFIENIKYNEIDLKEVGRYMMLNKTSNLLLLHVIDDQKLKSLDLQNQASFLGYDVGVCQDEQSIYSSIFNEILFGTINELTVFKNHLNKSLIFPNREMAEIYVKVHNEMSAQGKDVEDYMEMIIYEIWKDKRFDELDHSHL